MTAFLIIFGLLVMAALVTAADRWWNQYVRDTQHGPVEKWPRVAIEDPTAEEDCFASCFVAYAGKHYDHVCDVHFDAIGAQLLEEREASRG